jgi:hypothetical protein
MTKSSICPSSSEDCTTPIICFHKCKRHLGPTPLDFILEDVKPLTHFVGFRNLQQYQNAILIFGEPDIIHYVYDERAKREIAYNWDKVIFANYHNEIPTKFSYDDSNQIDDPARYERSNERNN